AAFAVVRGLEFRRVPLRFWFFCLCRDQVDFFVVKEFTERYDARVQGRIAAIKPHRSTRMGPAIRHAMRKFAQQEARVKLLLLLSDGYPQDYDYGKDRKSKEYGIQDTT